MLFAKFLQGFSRALTIGGLIALILAEAWGCPIRAINCCVALYSIGIVLMRGGHEWQRR
jgi:hypothetical protein